ncbi:MAG: hypothetical protein KKD44_24435 [Proteobacteria bacterium]|nr:hypothetical protein [Pseudomonadota bacterium]
MNNLPHKTQRVSFACALLFLFIFAIFLSGCGRKHTVERCYGVIPYASPEVEAQAKSFPPLTSDKPVIYIIKKDEFTGAIPFYAWLDGVQVAMMSRGSFIMLPVESGEHTISAHVGWKGLSEMHHSKKTSALIECFPGRRYFLLMEADSGSARLKQIPESEGIETVKLSDFIRTSIK